MLSFVFLALFSWLCVLSFTEFGYDDHVQDWSGRRTPIMLVHGMLDTDVSVGASDAMNAQLKSLGWTDDILVYHRLKKVAHRWQPQMNQILWDFLSGHVLPQGGTP